MWNGLLAALSLNLLFVWSVMAAGEAEGSLSGELKELFESTNNSVKLGAALVVALVTYFIAVVKIKDVDEVPKNDPEELEEAAAEAWQEEFAAAGIKRPAYGITAWNILTIIQHGNQDQLDRWVEPALNQDVIWCQLFSEKLSLESLQ